MVPESLHLWIVRVLTLSKEESSCVLYIGLDISFLSISKNMLFAITLKFDINISSTSLKDLRLDEIKQVPQLNLPVVRWCVQLLLFSVSHFKFLAKSKKKEGKIFPLFFIRIMLWIIFSFWK